jgi:hypothetical protein
MLLVVGIEGNDIDDYHPSEQQNNTLEDNIDEHHDSEKKKKGRTLPLIVGMVLGLIIGIIISPIVIDIFNDDTPIWKEHTKHEGEDRTVYQNSKLNVSIIITQYPSSTYYEADWKELDGGTGFSSAYSNPLSLLDGVLYYANDMTTNQLAWFEYTLKFVVE